MAVGAIVIEGHVQGLAVTRSLGRAGVPVYLINKNNYIDCYSKHIIKFYHNQVHAKIYLACLNQKTKDVYF